MKDDVVKARLEALEASSVAVWDYDIPRGRVWISAEWGRMLGYGRVSGETTPEALLELVPPADRAAISKALQETLQGSREEYRVEHRVKGKQEMLWILSAGRVVARDTNGRALHLVGTNANITPIKEAEAAVKRKEEQLRLIMDAAPALIAYLDKDLLFRFHNKGYETLLGLRRDEIDGRHAAEVIGDAEFRQTEAFARRALAGETVEFERKQSTATGGTVHLAARFVPHRGPDGEVAGFIGVLVDITERKAIEEKMAALAREDPLTGLPNRRTLDDRLAQAIPLVMRREGKLAILFLDLDGFKPINDRLGHEAGDAVLVEVGKRLTALVRRSDTVARVGGDEFVLLLMDVHSREAVGRKASELISEVTKPIRLANGPVVVGITIGIALCPTDGSTAAELIRNADSAMYVAKRAGRGSWRFVQST